MPPKENDPEVQAELEVKFNDCVGCMVMFDASLLPQFQSGVANAQPVKGTNLLHFPVQIEKTKGRFLKPDHNWTQDPQGDTHGTISLTIL
ncbi:MAG TPA: hypothetical protein VLW65_03360 [Bryobacteraceae bacterium]|nr:hypothetical protein [Bryobacteraceae bacterium]